MHCPGSLWGVLILALDIFRDYYQVAEICGIGIPINMIFFLGFCFLLALLFTLECTGIQFISKKD